MNYVSENIDLTKSFIDKMTVAIKYLILLRSINGHEITYYNIWFNTSKFVDEMYHINARVCLTTSSFLNIQVNSITTISEINHQILLILKN